MVPAQAALQTDHLKSTEPLIKLRGSASPKKAIVFIHGIGAKDPKKYWQQFTAVLLQDSDALIKDFDVYVWGYPTHKGPKRLINLTRFLFTGRPINAAPEIGRLGGLWRTTYQAQFREYQDIVLVCHSMGGLVVKSYIVDVLAEGHSSELETVKHITFYATPHSGAPMAGIAWNDQLKGMTITGEFVERIRRSWDEHVVRWNGLQIGLGDLSYNRFIPHLALHGAEDLVVPYNLAVISGGIACKDVPGDHTTIIQPGDTNDTRYRFWRNELEKIFAPRPPANPPGPINIADYAGKRDNTKPSQNAPFLEWAHYYIKTAKEETQAARKSLTEPGYFDRTEYINKFLSLGEIKKSLGEFQKRIADTPQLPSEITLPREQLRVNVSRALKQIEAIQSCIKDWASPCSDIEEKFKPLVSTLGDLGKDCKLKDQ